jgi:hypothetical protein
MPYLQPRLYIHGLVLHFYVIRPLNIAGNDLVLPLLAELLGRRAALERIPDARLSLNGKGRNRNPSVLPYGSKNRRVIRQQLRHLGEELHPHNGRISYMTRLFIFEFRIGVPRRVNSYRATY